MKKVFNNNNKNKSNKSKQKRKNKEQSFDYDIEKLKYNIDTFDLISIIIVLKCICGDNCERLSEELNIKTIRKLYKKLEKMINRTIIIK